jgi:hypothetical protein
LGCLEEKRRRLSERVPSDGGFCPSWSVCGERKRMSRNTKIKRRMPKEVETAKVVDKHEERRPDRRACEGQRREKIVKGEQKMGDGRKREKARAQLVCRFRWSCAVE